MEILAILKANTASSETEEEADVSQVSHNNNQYDVDMPNPEDTLDVTTAPVSVPSVCRNNTRGRGRRSSQNDNKSPYNWSRDTTSFIEQTFSPREPTCPKSPGFPRLFFLVLG